MSEKVLRIGNIYQSFAFNDVLREINLKIMPREFIEVRGKNASGKTTLLRIIAGLTIPTKGRVSYGLNPLDNKDRSYIPSYEEGLFERLTGRENIDLFSKVLKCNNKALKKREEKWSELDFFKQALETPFYKCSSGMKKVLMTYTLSMHTPPFIILDEPFANLHKDAAQKMIHFLEEEHPQRSLILSNHSTSFETSLKKRVVTLNGGQIVF